MISDGLAKLGFEQTSLDLEVRVQILAGIMYVVLPARLNVLYVHNASRHLL